MITYTDEDKRKHQMFLRAAKKAGLKVPKVTQWWQGGRKRQVAPGGTRRRAGRKVAGEGDAGAPRVPPEDEEPPAEARSCSRAHSTLRKPPANQKAVLQAPPPPAAAEAAEDSDWAKGRAERTVALLAALQPRIEQEQAAFAELRLSVSRCLQSASCRVCHAAGRPTGAARQVEVLTRSHAFVAEVPVFTCGTCCVGGPPDVRPLQFTPTPLQAGCWPGTPETAWNLLKAPGDRVPLWLGRDLLEDLVLLQVASHAGFSYESVAAHLLERWKGSGCTATMEASRLGEVLRAALPELAYSQYTVHSAVVGLRKAWAQPATEGAAGAELAEPTEA